MTTLDILHETAKSLGGEYREWDTGRLHPSECTEEELAAGVPGVERNFMFLCPGLQLCKMMPIASFNTAERDSDIIRAQIIIRLSNAGVAWMQYHDDRIASRFQNW